MSNDQHPELRFDHAGNPVRVPPHSRLGYEYFAKCVEALTPDCCSYPSGQLCDPLTKEPCRRERVGPDGCELHASRKAAKELLYARRLPKRIRKAFALAATDDELLNISHDVALVNARLQELSGRLDTGESGEAWMNLQELWSDFMTANANAKRAGEAGDDVGRSKWLGKVQEISGQIGKAIRSGNENERNWRDIIECSTLLSKLKMSETQRRREAGQVLDMEQAYLFVDKINNCILDNVKDPQIRNRIAHDMAIALGLAGIRSTRGGVVQSEPERIDVAIEQKPVAKPRRLSVDEMLGE